MIGKGSKKQINKHLPYKLREKVHKLEIYEDTTDQWLRILAVRPLCMYRSHGCRFGCQKLPPTQNQQ